MCEETVVIFSGSGSRAGTLACAKRRESTPASIALLKGGNSILRKCPRSPSIDASARCESTEVSPFPGKCLAVTSRPFACAPRMKAATKAPTCSGSSPNDRSLITGLAGQLLTSAAGAGGHKTPIPPRGDRKRKTPHPQNKKRAVAGREEKDTPEL